MTYFRGHAITPHKRRTAAQKTGICAIINGTSLTLRHISRYEAWLAGFTGYGGRSSVVERRVVVADVAGSNPVDRPIFFPHNAHSYLFIFQSLIIANLKLRRLAAQKMSDESVVCRVALCSSFYVFRDADRHGQPQKKMACAQG